MNSNRSDGKITTTVTTTNINKTKRQTNTKILKKLLEDRLQAVRNDESLLTTGRWTQSTVYYTFRLHIDKLIKDGVNVKLTTRKHITDSIKDICDKMGYKRHELGIVAASRAELYFRGESYGVGFDEIEKLIEKGTDLIIIEKEGAVEILGPYADKYGIALLYTRGFATEYAFEVSRRTKSNILVLTDYDASGLLIAEKLPKQENIHWIGIRPEMVKELLDTVDLSEVEEEYKPDSSHFGVLEDIAAKVGDPELKSWLENLSEKRIEIDSVLAKVSPEDLWNYILQKLEEKFPTRNYNRSIKIKYCVMPSILEDLIDNVADRIAEIQTPRREEIVRELKNVKGFFEDVEEKEIEIVEDLRSIVESYGKTEIKNIVTEEINKLFNSFSESGE
jgi:hypothetical protein